MKKQRKPESFVPQPTYPDGPQALKAFLKKHLRYPEEARAHKIDGTVRLRIDIDHQGKVIGSKIMSSLGYGCNEEAQRLVKLLIFDVPKTRKLRVTYHKTINIHFRYQEATAQKATPPFPTPPTTNSTTITPKDTALQYTVVKRTPPAATAAQKETASAKKKTYHYTININQ